ncbi:MAG: helix-turn-helix transcriptional regulator [bacterium]
MREPYIIFKNIKKARVVADLSQKELAEKLGVSDKTVSAYETGRAIPPTVTLAKIAEITKVSISDMLGPQEGDYPDKDIRKRLERMEERVSNLEQTIIKLMKGK